MEKREIRIWKLIPLKLCLYVPLESFCLPLGRTSHPKKVAIVESYRPGYYPGSTSLVIDPCPVPGAGQALG